MSVAYADDISVFSPTVSGLQDLINICYSYAQKWRFTFGIKKSKCMIAGKNLLVSDPSWTLGDKVIVNEDYLDIMGVTIDNKGTCQPHIDKRMQKCKQSYFGLVASGLSYPGLNSDAKAYMWKLVCQPTLLYAQESIHLSQADLHKLESLQGTLMKKMNGICKRSHHSHLLQALDIPSVSACVHNRVLSL